MLWSPEAARAWVGGEIMDGALRDFLLRIAPVFWCHQIAVQGFQHFFKRPLTHNEVFKLLRKYIVRRYRQGV